MKKILSTLLAVLLLASLCSTAFADEWQEVYEENGFTLTFTDAFRTENLKGIFSPRIGGRIDDGLYYAEFIYMGISEEDIPHIFDRFFRADPARTRSTGGTGLGLSIAQWIVEKHNGYFDVFSREDIGTRIGVILPG